MAASNGKSQQPPSLPTSFRLFPNISQFSQAIRPNYQPQPQSPTSVEASATTHATSTSSPTETAAPIKSVEKSSNSNVPTPGITTAVEPQSQQVYAADCIKPMAALPIDCATYKGYKCIHLDPHIEHTSEEYATCLGIYGVDHCKSDIVACLKLIKETYQTNRIFVLVSGGIGAQIVPQIHELPQVYGIYIKCVDVKSHRGWSKQYSKVRVVCFDDIRDLLPVLTVDAAQCYIDWGDALVKIGDSATAKKRYENALRKLETVKKSDPNMRTHIMSQMQKLN